MEHISASPANAGDPLLEFEAEEPEVVAVPREAGSGRAPDLRAEDSERPRKAPTFVIVTSFAPQVQASKPEARTMEPAPPVIETGPRLAARLTAARRRAAVVTQRYVAMVALSFLSVCRASYRAARLLASHLSTRGEVLWSRVRTISARSPQFLGSGSKTAAGTAPLGVAFPDALSNLNKIAASIAAATREQLWSAWQVAVRLGERVLANTRAIRREIPVPFALIACLAFGAVTFVLGRLSVPPAPAAPTGVSRASVTSFEPAAPNAPRDQTAASVAATPTVTSPVRTTGPVTPPAAPRVASPARTTRVNPPVNSQAASRTQAPRAPATSPRVAPRPVASEAAGAPFRGSLAVSSSPQGAQVSVNGVSAGTTPLVLRNLPVGSRALRVVLDGYAPWSSTVQIVTDRRTETSARLSPLPRQ